MGNSASELEISRLTRFPLLTKQEAAELPARIAAGDRAAFERFIEGNQRLVAKWALWYAKNRSIEASDAFSEGNIGLMKAIRKFEPERGFAFATHATWWIRNEIQRAIANRSRLVRVPDRISVELKQINRALYDLGLDVDDLRSEAVRLRVCTEVPCEMAHLEERMRWLGAPRSLDASMASGGEDSEADLYGLGYGSVFDESWLDAMGVIGVLREVLQPTDAVIVALRVGLDGGGEREWPDVAALVGMKHKAVAKRGRKALKQLAAVQAMRKVIADG